MEDLSQCKSDDGATCFKALASFKERSYLPNVVDAVNGLYDNLESSKASIDQSDDILEAVDGGNRVIFVYLEVADDHKDYENHGKVFLNYFMSGHVLITHFYSALQTRSSLILLLNYHKSTKA